MVDPMNKISFKGVAIALTMALTVVPQAWSDDKTQNYGELVRSPVAVKISKPVGPLTLIDEKGILYSLTGLDIPEGAMNDPDFMDAEQKLLGEITTKQTCILFQTRNSSIGRINRMGQTLGHLECGAEKIWVQGKLLANGLARVRTIPSNPELSDELYRMEAEAREKKLGLWAKTENQILTPNTAGNHINSFQIVEGKIAVVAQTRERVYLNFSQDWKTDFTIAVPTSLTRQFMKQRVNMLSLKGATVRARGWIRPYNGPYLELDHVQQLEILSPSASSSPSSPVVKNTPDSPQIGGMHTISGPAAPQIETPKVETPTVSKPDIKKPEIGKPNQPALKPSSEEEKIKAYRPQESSHLK